jgi:hypothetical protein
VIAGRSDFERALGHGLTPHVAKVGMRGVFALHLGERGGCGNQGIRLIQKPYNVFEMLQPEDPNAFRDSGFRRIGNRNQQVADAAPRGAHRDG